MGCASVKEFNLYLYYTNFSRETGHACPIYFPFLLSSLTPIRLYCPLDKVFHSGPCGKNVHREHNFHRRQKADSLRLSAQGRLYARARC